MTSSISQNYIKIVHNFLEMGVVGENLLNIFKLKSWYVATISACCWSNAEASSALFSYFFFSLAYEIAL